MRTFSQKQNTTRAGKSENSAMPGRVISGQSSKVQSILHLQRTVGNEAVLRLLQSEPEVTGADFTATTSGRHDFTHIPVNAQEPVRTPPKAGANTSAEILQQKELPENSPAKQQASELRGQPLDESTRMEMESRIGHNFSSVRIHTDGGAAASAHDLRASAYTIGEDITIASGRYRPGTTEGTHLIAHELAHVVQQRRGGAAPVRARGSVHEREADSVADAFVAKAPIPSITQGTSVGLACREESESMSAAHAGGIMGERDSAFILGQRGFEVIIGPAGPGGHQLTASGLDIVAYNPDLDQLWIVDNKASGGTGNVSSATAITNNLKKNLTTAIAHVQGLPDFPNKAKVLQHLGNTLDAVAKGQPIPSKVRLVVTSAGGYHSGISAELKKKGIHFEDFTGTQVRDARRIDIAKAKAQGVSAGRPVTKPSSSPGLPATTANEARPSAQLPGNRGQATVSRGRVRISLGGGWSLAGKIGTGMSAGLTIWDTLSTIDSAMEQIEKAQTGSVAPQVAAAIKMVETTFPSAEGIRNDVLWYSFTASETERKYPEAREWLHNNGVMALMAKGDLLTRMNDELYIVRSYAWDQDKLEREFKEQQEKIEPLMTELRKRIRVLNDIVQDLENILPYMFLSQVTVWGIRTTFWNAAQDLGRLESIASFKHWEYRNGYLDAQEKYRASIEVYNYWEPAFAEIWNRRTRKTASPTTPPDD